MEQKASRLRHLQSFELKIPGLRKSTSSLFRRIAGSANPQVPEKVRRNLAELLVTLPHEIQIHILQYLDLASIQNLRVVSRDFYSVIKSCESAYIRPHIKHIEAFARWQTELYTPPAPSEGTIRYLIQYSHRAAACLELAAHVLLEKRQLSQFYAHDRREQQLMQQHGFGVRCLCRRYDFLRDCSASVFGLTHFLEAYRTVVLRRALANVDRSKKQTFAFVCGTTDWEDQTSILQLYPDYLLLAGTCMLKELLDTLDRKIMRNVPDKIWNTHNISPMEISILVLIGGVRKTLQVLAEPDIECRKHALRRFIRRLHPRVGRDWKKNWVDLKLPPDIVAQLDKLRHAKIGVPPLKVLWLEPALKVLIKSNAIREDQFRW